jgi:predicted DNA-binding transcriptional regulator YafY
VKPTKRRDAQMVRILAELGILLEGGLPTVHELAARFHTRRETIYRDLRTLQDAGYPSQVRADCSAVPGYSTGPGRPSPAFA